MPPKKAPKISEGPPSTRTTRGRQKKTLSPISIQIQIPVQESLDIPRKRTRKSKIPFDRQIELANEVIRTQLARKVQIQHNADVNDKEPAATPDNHTIVIENNAKENNGKMVTRKVTRKGAYTKTEPIVKPSSPCKRAADSTQQPAKRRKVTVKDTTSVKKNIGKKQTAATKNVQNKRTGRGKRKIQDLVCVVENCLPTEKPVDNVQHVDEPTAAAIDSRKTSMTSASSLSWTKDISSSSTTTCVTVATNDFVRIDKKIPVLQLTNVDNLIDKYKRPENEASTSSDSSSSSDSESIGLLDVPCGSLNLSTSSLSTFKCTENQAPKSDSLKHDVAKALVKLSSLLQNFDMEIMNWIGYNDNVDDDTKKCNEKILNVLKEESEIIAHCRQLKNILSDKSPDEVDKADNTTQNNILVNDLNVSFDDENPVKNNVLLNDNIEDLGSPKTPSIAYDSDDSLDNLNRMTFDRSNDDDDALSLFAESITGIETSRTNNSEDSPRRAELDIDEYIPQPLNKDASCSSEKYEYHPTVITKPNETVKKNVCEKQNADSTSIYKDVGGVDNIYQGEVEGLTSEVPAESDNMEDGEIPNTEELPNQIGPPPAVSIFRRIPYRSSTTIFKGICFYNLMKVCKKIRCPYPHLVPTANDIQMCLRGVNEQTLINEYIFLSSWPVLRRKYGLHFVEECHRRGLPRVLVEMAIDYVLNYKLKCREDYDFQMSVLEQILLSLNDVGLVVCEDLLNYPLYDGERLCDVLMGVIANSQNFQRFKHVFVNLTNVMVRNRRTFTFTVAEQLIERVCILPTDERIARAVFDIIKNTDSCILGGSMIFQFEARLKAVSAEWHEEFKQFRNKNFNTSSMNVGSISPDKGKELEPLKINCINNVEKERYTSPDTTNVDTLQNKSTTAPVIARTVNFMKTGYFNSTPKKNNVEDWLNNKYNYRQRTAMRPPFPLMAMPFIRPKMPPKNRLVNYRTPSPRYRPRPPRYF